MIEKEEVLDSAAKVLDDAADWILVNGWVRGTLENDKGNVCALGALRGVVFGTQAPTLDIMDSAKGFLYAIASEAFEDHLSERFGTHSVPFWNDDQAADEFEVMDEMRRCAKGLRERAHERPRIG
jgi:hypothetical protein